LPDNEMLRAVTRQAARRVSSLPAFPSGKSLISYAPLVIPGGEDALINGLATMASAAPTSTPTTVLSSVQATEGELLAWCKTSCGLRDDVAKEYASTLANEGLDSAAALAMATPDELARTRIRLGHARMLLAKAADLSPAAAAPAGGLAPPKLFDYATVTSNVSVADAVEAIEEAFGKLAEGKVDVPFPMHIGIDETPTAGPGDCHIKGGYVSGAKTWTVKLACVSFYKNLEHGLPPGGGIFVVMNAETGAPLAIMQENRYLTDLRTGAAGATAVKHLSAAHHTNIGFIGTGAIAKSMARGAAAVRPGYTGYAYAFAGAEEFCKEMSDELGCDFLVCDTPQDLCAKSDVVFTQTPGSATVLERSWLRPHATVIASGSDQPTKQELPVDLLANSKYVVDLVKQCARVGELRSAIKAGVMDEDDVYAEIGEIVNGSKPGREGNELIVVDLTGTGAQDAAIGQVAWEKLSQL